MSEDIYLDNPVQLMDLCDGPGPPRWELLAAMVADADMLVGELLDEELRLCRRFVGLAAPPDPHWTPYQWCLEPRLQDVALSTVERVLVGKEMITYGDQAPGGQPRASFLEPGVALFPFQEAIAYAFAHAVAQLTWRCDFGDRGERSGGVLVLEDATTVLHDDVDVDGGQHVLTFRAREREVVHVAGGLDPDGAPAAAAPSVQPPSLGELEELAVTATTLEVAPVWRSGEPWRRVRTYVGRHGAWVVDDGGAHGPSGEVRPIDAAGIKALARQLLFAPQTAPP